MSPEAGPKRASHPVIAQLIIIIALVGFDQLLKTFSPGAENSLRVAPIIGTSTIFAALYLLYKVNYSRLISAGIMAVVAGGVSNLGDYFMRGAVRDNLHLINLDFNLADVYVIVGISTILHELRQGKIKPR